MPTTRLVVDLPEPEIAFLKQYAKRKKTTVSELINRWIKGLENKSKPAIHPDIKKFTGIIPGDIDVDKAISDYLVEKHK
jgi:hypothetical protein